MNETLCIILARAGSKRLQNKNMRSFLGLPLIERTITQAINAGFKSIVVSTDDEKIISLCEKYPEIVCIERDESISRDDSTSEQAILDVMSKVKKHKNIILLQVTSPLRLVSDVIHAQHLHGGCTVSTNESGKWNGAIYICEWNKFLKDKTFKPNRFYMMPDRRSVDIDTIEDFEQAEKYVLGEIE